MRAPLRRQKSSDATEPSLVWMLGSPRTGSTWLLGLLSTHQRVVGSDEPGIGYHLGLYTADVMGPHPASYDAAGLLLPASRAKDANYFFADQYEQVWREPLRRLILDRFAALLDKAEATGKVRDPLLVIKEPAGSQVAEFIFRLLPESRLLFLARDGRDVLDSELDAVTSSGWLTRLFSSDEGLSQAERHNFILAQAHRWVSRMRTVRAAYDALPASQRLLVRYEDLRRDTPRYLGEIFTWLGLDAGDDILEHRVKAMSFEALPAEQTGSGKFTRSASAGGWRESLTADEIEVVERIMGPTLAELGYTDSGGS